MTERRLGNGGRADELLRGLSEAEVSSLDDPMLQAVFGLVRDTQTMIRTANQRLAERDYRSAERLYREVLRLDPDSYDAHLNLGVLYGLGGPQSGRRPPHLNERSRSIPTGPTPTPC